MRFKRKGNPNWGKPLPFDHYKALPTEFELQVKALHLDGFESWRTSGALRRWVYANYKSRYVPEALLKAWGIHVEVEV